MGLKEKLFSGVDFTDDMDEEKAKAPKNQSFTEWILFNKKAMNSTVKIGLLITGAIFLVLTGLCVYAAIIGSPAYVLLALVCLGIAVANFVKFRNMNKLGDIETTAWDLIWKEKKDPEKMKNVTPENKIWKK